MSTDRVAPLSPAAERAMRHASSLANACGADQIEPVHLLVAVLLEAESRGAALVARYGGHPESIAKRLLEPSQPPPADEPAALPLSPTTRTALRHARSGTLVPRGLHAGTDHLLIALLRCDPALQDALRRAGVDVGQLLAAVVTPDEEVAHGSPIPLDEDDLGEASPEREDTAEHSASTADESPPSVTAANFEHLFRSCIQIAYDLIEATRTPGAAQNAAPEAAKLLAILLDIAAQRGISAAPVGRLKVQGDAPSVAARLSGLLHALATCESVPAARKRLSEAATLAEAVAARTSRFGQLREQLRQARLYVLIGAECPLRIVETARRAVAGGADVIQLRLKGVTDRQLLEAAIEVQNVVAESGALFIVNDRPDVAVLADADGVHVGQDELPVAAVRRLIGAERLVGLSTHSPEQAREAVLLGADYIGVGPVFPSKTKQFDRLAGLELVEQVCPASPIPAFAIGGISPENIEAVLRAGARRVAVSHAVCGAPDPEAAARRLRRAIDEYRA